MFDAMVYDKNANKPTFDGIISAAIKRGIVWKVTTGTITLNPPSWSL